MSCRRYEYSGLRAEEPRRRVLPQFGAGGGALASVMGALLPITVEGLTGVVAGGLVFLGVLAVGRMRQMLRTA